jgi:hypothetical protein
MKYFGIEYPTNFPLSESAFEKIVFKLLCNVNISAKGAEVKITNHSFWDKTSVLFNKLDFEVADFEEDDLKRIINELRFLKYSISACSCDVSDKVSFKLVSWLDLFGPLAPFELLSFCKVMKVEYRFLSEVQFNHILQSPTSEIQKTTTYLRNWAVELSHAKIDLLLDKINQQELERNQDKTLARKI